MGIRHLVAVLLSLAALAAVLLLAHPAFAQDPLQRAARGMDLPVARPTQGSPDAGFEHQPPELDPADETPEPVTFWGDEIAVEEGICYVLDRSCSMSTAMGPGTRWERAEVELRASVSSLRPDLDVGAVEFHHWTKAWRAQLVPATRPACAELIAWVEALYPSGGTEIAAGTIAGLSLPDQADVIVLLTDGHPRDAELDRARIRAANTRRAQIHVYGIGITTERARSFCRGVAADSGGRFVDCGG